MMGNQLVGLLVVRTIKIFVTVVSKKVETTFIYGCDMVISISKIYLVKQLIKKEYEKDSRS